MTTYRGPRRLRALPLVQALRAAGTRGSGRVEKGAARPECDGADAGRGGRKSPRRRLVTAVPALVVIVGALVLARARADAGPVVRTVALGSTPSLLAVDAPAHRLFIANSGDSTVGVLDGETGEVLRTVTVGAAFDPLAGLAVDTHTGHALVVTADKATHAGGRLVMLDARSGALLRRAVVGHISAGIAVDERTARAFVYNCADGTVSVVDTRTGAVLATRRVGPPGSGTFQVGDPVVVDARRGRVFVMHMSEVYTLDAATGAMRAEVSLSDSALSMALDGRDGRLFVTSADGILSVLDAGSGRLLRRLNRGPGVLAADERTGRIFLARQQVDTPLPFSGPQRLTLLDGRTGAVLRDVALDSPSYALALDAGGTRLLVATVGTTDAVGRPLGYGSVEVFDTPTLTVRGRIPVGVVPGAVALGGRPGGAFVLNTATDPENGSALRVRAPESAWARLVGAAQRAAPWLHLASPQPEYSPRTGSLTVLDLTRL